MLNKTTHSPASFTPSIYRQATQWVNKEKEIPLLQLEDLKKIERAIGIFYYYTWAVNITMIVVINNLLLA